MAYDRAYNPSLKSREPLKPTVKDARPPVAIFLQMISETDFGNVDSQDRLLTWLRSNKAQNRHILHKLAETENVVWTKESGKDFLRWLWIQRQYRFLFTTGIGPPAYKTKTLPLHLAIQKANHGFLDCFLNLCSDDSGSGISHEAKEVLKEPNDHLNCNCLHEAIKEKLPCAARMVKVCSEKVLEMPNADGDTPLHLAMQFNKADGRQGPRRPPKRPQEPTAPNITRTRTDLRDDSDDAFNPSRLVEHMSSTYGKKFMGKLLTKINHVGESPYQTRLNRFNIKEYEEGQPITVQEKEENEEEKRFQSYLKRLIFETVEDIPNASRALYGSHGYEKELCLDMSDFNQSTHDFKRFVERLTKLDPYFGQSSETERQGLFEEVSTENHSTKRKETIGFEDTLFFVYLPDLNNIRKPCPHEGVRLLFSWLKKKNIQRIKTLNIPDSTTSPMSEELVEEGIIHKFEIEKFDWRKLDINLEILTTSPHAAQFTELTLYSSGNWSVLYHWISKHGLAGLERLEVVKIHIVQLNPTEGVHDQAARTRHSNLAKAYKSRLDQELRALRDDDVARSTLNVNYKLHVVEDAKWDFPVVQYKENEEPFVPTHQFLNQLVPTSNYLERLATSQDGRHETFNFKQIIEPPWPGMEDNRIKVAIIDNGVDRIRTSVRDQIVKGISYVTADRDGSRILPWWMVADPHGTQMASLIGKTNKFCRLYIARVGKGRKDILPENAAKAIEWALEQRVDIISMSWVTKKPCLDLEAAVGRAVSEEGQKRPTLIFCSTADEGMYSGEVWPAGYDKTLRIAATDRYGYRRPFSENTDDVNILVPGEDIEADGPTYMERYVEGTASGSSVATALAAGIASLALLMIKTFNNKVSDEDWAYFHKKEGILRIFKKMKGDQAGVRLSELFPDPPCPDNDLSQILREEWNIEKLKAVSN